MSVAVRIFFRILDRAVLEMRIILRRMRQAAEEPLLAGPDARVPAWLERDLHAQAALEPALATGQGLRLGYRWISLPRVDGPGRLIEHLGCRIAAQGRERRAWLLVEDPDQPLVARVIADLLARQPDVKLLVLDTSAGAKAACRGACAGPAPWVAVHHPDITLRADQMQRVLASLIVQFSPASVSIVGSQLGWDTVAQHGKALANASILCAVIPGEGAMLDGYEYRRSLRNLREVEPHLDCILLDDDTCFENAVKWLGISKARTRLLAASLNGSMETENE